VKPNTEQERLTAGEGCLSAVGRCICVCVCVCLSECTDVWETGRVWRARWDRRGVELRKRGSGLGRADEKSVGQGGQEGSEGRRL
jgi:hypothetical protein